MVGIFEFWSGMVRGSAAIIDTQFRLAEALDASRRVIDSRTQKIVHAARSPLDGDYREFGRMVPEKVEALSRSAVSAVSNLQAVQSQMLDNWHTLVCVGMEGRVATVAEVGTVVRRNGRIVEILSSAGGDALAPAHRTVTANARRLSRDKTVRN